MGVVDESTYEPLLAVEDGPVLPASKPRSTRPYIIIIIVVEAILILIFMSLWISTRRLLPDTPDRHTIRPLYSPAQSVLEDQLVKFTGGFGRERSIYEGDPSPEVDQAWEDLYQMGISSVPRSQAALMVNKTLPVAEDPSMYVVSIDVFHQLHCLNMLRKAIHPEYYPAMNMSSPDSDDWLHSHHCVDSLRQSLMCSSDLTPIVFQWDENILTTTQGDTGSGPTDQVPKAGVRIHMDVPHRCRNFEKIRQWGVEHALQSALNYSVNVSDDLIVAGLPL